MKKKTRTIVLLTVAVIILFITIALIWIRFGKKSLTDSDNPIWYKASGIMQDTVDNFDYSEVENKSEDLTHSEKVEAYQIPNEQLESMSTKGLLISCIEYPLTIDMLAYSSIRKGYLVVKEHFNGLEELSKRSDSAEILYSMYSSLDFDYVIESDEFPITNMITLELIMTDDDILANTTHSMRVGAIRKCIERIVGDALTKEGKKFDQTSSLLFLSRTMYYDNEEFKALVDEDEDLSNFVLNNGRGIPDTSITQELYNKVMDIALSYYGG